MVDHRDVVLQAIKERYADDDYMAVSNKPVSTVAIIFKQLL
jgi:hypothetical protein